MTDLTKFGDYLYNRLPGVYKTYDVEIVRNGKTFRTLQEYLKALVSGGFNPLLTDLECLVSLMDPMKCPKEFLPLLLKQFGLGYVEDIDEKFQRRLVQNIVLLYKQKGTLPAITFLARELSNYDIKVTEKIDKNNKNVVCMNITVYEGEDGLETTQDVIERYIQLFLPANTQCEFIVSYNFTDGAKFNGTSEDTTVYGFIETGDDDIKITDYSNENFPLLTSVVEKDFSCIYSNYSESQYMPVGDSSFFTNTDYEDLFVYTNGNDCFDKIITGEKQVSFSSTPMEFDGLYSGASLRITKATANLMPCSPLLGTTTEFIPKNTLITFVADSGVGERNKCVVPCDLYASDKYPTYFVYNNISQSVQIYNSYVDLWLTPSNVGEQIENSFVLDNFFYSYTTADNNKYLNLSPNLYYSRTSAKNAKKVLNFDGLCVYFSHGYNYISYPDVPGDRKALIDKLQSDSYHIVAPITVDSGAFNYHRLDLEESPNSCLSTWDSLDHVEGETYYAVKAENYVVGSKAYLFGNFSYKEINLGDTVVIKLDDTPSLFFTQNRFEFTDNNNTQISVTDSAGRKSIKDINLDLYKLNNNDEPDKLIMAQHGEYESYEIQRAHKIVSLEELNDYYVTSSGQTSSSNFMECVYDRYDIPIPKTMSAKETLERYKSGNYIYFTVFNMSNNKTTVSKPAESALSAYSAKVINVTEGDTEDTLKVVVAIYNFQYKNIKAFYDYCKSLNMTMPKLVISTFSTKLEPVTDSDVINKLADLSNGDNYAKIVSDGVPYVDMGVKGYATINY